MNVASRVERIAVRMDETSSYLKTIEFLSEHIDDQEERANPNKVSYILFCAAALECILNETRKLMGSDPN